jgi:hypothetical protein
MLEDEKSMRSGKFSVSGREIYGELTLAGAKTSLQLHDLSEFSIAPIPNQTICGVLHDLTKVTLVQCILLSAPTGTRSDGHFYEAAIFPHFVLSGDCYLDPNEKCILGAHFVVDDATTAFYDFDAFGLVITPRPFIDQIANANESLIHRKVETGPEPRILYFTGKQEIFSVNTVLGQISASHSPGHNLGGPEGVWLKNTIGVSITFPAPVTFEHFTNSVLTVLTYVGLLVGRPQNLVRLTLRTQTNLVTSQSLEVYWSSGPRRNRGYEGPNPQPAEVLLSPIRNLEEFAQVLVNWLSRHVDFRDARLRFFNSFDEQIRYGIDRLIGSANMFDILPSYALPSDLLLSKRLTAAKESAQKRFRRLLGTSEHDIIVGVLGDLGRITKSKLRHKIRHRAQIVIDATSDRLEEITTVTDEAVKCRNHYVHGSDPRFDYSANAGMLEFFSDTLEFVFAASDLIECGWDIKSWSKAGSSMAHPFGRFLVEYRNNLQRLKKLI